MRDKLSVMVSVREALALKQRMQLHVGVLTGINGSMFERHLR